MIHKLWYLELALECAALAILAWKRDLPWFCVWLAVDLITAAIDIWIDHARPAMFYQRAWLIEQPLLIGVRFMAAREAWRRLGGRTWLALSFAIAVLIHLARVHHLPKSLVEAEFAMVAVVSAALGITLWLTVDAAREAYWNRATMWHIRVMAAYFLLSGLCYYVAWGYRNQIGRATGVVAVMAYASWIWVFLNHRHRNEVQ